MTENIEPQFDLAAQDTRELARRATVPAPDAEPQTEVVGDATTVEAAAEPQPPYQGEATQSP